MQGDPEIGQSKVQKPELQVKQRVVTVVSSHPDHRLLQREELGRVAHGGKRITELLECFALVEELGGAWPRRDGGEHEYTRSEARQDSPTQALANSVMMVRMNHAYWHFSRRVRTVGGLGHSNIPTAPCVRPL